jgi:Fe-S cluster biosynthesis and repair protein YggX
MSRMIYCVKSQKEAEGLQAPPYPGKLGEEIYLHISKEAWQKWLQRQIMFINEYRLNLADVKSRAMLESEMQKFLFSNEDVLPEGYRAE